MGGEQLSDHEIRATLPFRVIFIHFCRVSFDLLWEQLFSFLVWNCLWILDTFKVLKKWLWEVPLLRLGLEEVGGVSGTGSGRMLCFGQIHVESCNDDDDLDNFDEDCDRWEGLIRMINKNHYVQAAALLWSDIHGKLLQWQQGYDWYWAQVGCFWVWEWDGHIYNRLTKRKTHMHANLMPPSLAIWMREKWFCRWDSITSN